MQSNTYSVAGTSAYQGSKDAYPTVSSVPRLSGSFTVANGLVQGDHKSPNPISFYRREDECTFAERTLYVRSKYGGGATRYWGNNPQHNSNGVPLKDPDQGLLGVGVIRDQALAKIYDQLRGNSETVVDLLEGAATIRMFRASAAAVKGVGKVLDSIAREARKRKLSRKAVTADWVTGKWLEYRYGWMPLVSSVYDALDNLSRVEANEVREIVARSGNRGSKTYSEVLPQSNTYGNFKARGMHIFSERILLVYKFDLENRNQLSDWTSLNPATIAWELLPFSFIADWFVSVGDSLRNLENWWLWHSKFRGGYETYTAKAEINRLVDRQIIGFTPRSVGYEAGYTAEEVRGYRAIRTVRKIRSVVATLPAPRGPRFRVKMGAKQVLDAGALLHVTIGKKFRSFL